MFYFCQKRKAIAAILVVLIASAVSLVLATGAVFLSLDNLDMTSSRKIGNKVLWLADSCLNLGYRRLQLDKDYLGESLSIDSGSCIISVTSNDPVFTVTSTAVIEDYTRGIESKIELVSGTSSVIYFNYLDNY